MKIWILVLGLGFAGFVRANEPAQEAFARGDFTGAIRAQEAVVERQPSAEGYYNLGLAREKAGDAVGAILSYERALLLDPGLRTARNALSKLAATQGVPAAPRSWQDDVTGVVHPELLLSLGGAIAWAGAFGFLFASQSRRRSGMMVMAGLAVLIGSAASAAGWMAEVRLSSVRPALVTAKAGAEVLSSPANNSNSILSVPAGTSLGVISPRGAWTYVDLNGGVRGWVQTDRLTPIIPGETL